MAILITTDGLERPVEPSDGRRFTLDEMQNLVGGYVQLLCLRNSRKMAFDEEGALKNLPVNQKATEIAQKDAGKSPIVDIVGTVVLFNVGEF